jgi:hypothetical protein
MKQRGKQTDEETKGPAKKITKQTKVVDDEPKKE